MRLLAASALAVLLAAAAARAENAAATLLPGDRLHGNILTPGEFDTLSIYMPSEGTFSVEALPEKGSAILPSLEVLDPADAPIDLAEFSLPGPGGAGVKVRNAPAGPTGGVFTFRVTGSGGTSGKYKFRVTAKMPKKWVLAIDLAGESLGVQGFEAPAGSRLKYAVKPGPDVPAGTFTMDGLRDPASVLAPLANLAGSGIELDQDGHWQIEYSNDGAVTAPVVSTVALTLPRASRRVLYLSPFGFGEAPKVRSVEPKKVLDDRPAPGVAITGANFDPEAALRLERAGQDDVLPTAYTVDGAGSITADFDPTGLKPGGWKVVVENPSGGIGKGKLAVQSASSVKLPEGTQPETEVWWLDFDKTKFREDLALMGLQAETSSSMSLLVEAAVKTYAFRYLRLAFGLVPTTGETQGGCVPVSFVLKEPPAIVGTPGAGYNRLRIGGVAGGGDPSSNPNYAWGNSLLDSGNLLYDDVVPEETASLGLRTRALVPSLGGSISGYYDALKKVQDQPLTANDAKYFFAGFRPKTVAESDRFQEIALAIDEAGKELGCTIAHFVARSMGLADGATGPALVPVKTGEYAALVNVAFSGADRTALAATVRDGLPGTAKVLKSGYIPWTTAHLFLLPNATTTQAYSVTLDIVGGRPERQPGDLEFLGVLGGIPTGFNLDLSGNISGTAPLRNPDTSLYGGVFKFIVQMRDTVSGDIIYFSHRINLLVDVADLGAPAEIAIAQQMNAATLAQP